MKAIDAQEQRGIFAWLDEQIAGMKHQADVPCHERPQIEARTRINTLKEVRDRLASD